MLSAKFALQIQIKFHGLIHSLTYVNVSRWKNWTSIFETKLHNFDVGKSELEKNEAQKHDRFRVWSLNSWLDIQTHSNEFKISLLIKLKVMFYLWFTFHKSLLIKYVPIFFHYLTIQTKVRNQISMAKVKFKHPKHLTQLCSRTINLLIR